MIQEKEIVENPLTNIDVVGFMKELKTLREEINASLGEEDIKHLKKIENWGLISNLLGILTAGIAPNIFSAAAMGLGRSTRWLLMHHIGHRGYDNVPGIPEKYKSKNFAKGWRRFIDWPDWMTPESWKYEHNVLHHSHTGETKDPDLLERNSYKIRNSNVPSPVKYAVVMLLGTMWKPVYYSPSNLHALRIDKVKEENGDFELNSKILQELILECYLPYTLLQFVIFPMLFLPLGPWSVFSAFSNSIMAELITNFHGFLVVGPNHTAEDIYRFNSKPKDRNERFLRQVLGSANYKMGNDVIDYLQFWLNYQIEHHLFPDIPMLKYQQFQPKIKALCEKYNVPYLEENVFIRFKKMLDVTVGKTSMKVID
jgi:fatty acid desaturase